MTDTSAVQKQKALASIKGLVLSDCIAFFDARASERDKKIADLVEAIDAELEVDNALISEGDDNGAYVLCWAWVSFSGTDFDKEPEA